MNENLYNYLNEPIPRYKMLVVGGFAVYGIATTFLTARSFLKVADETIEYQKTSINILKESTNFLLDHADNDTVAELNKNLDFWRIIVDHLTDDETEE